MEFEQLTVKNSLEVNNTLIDSIALLFCQLKAANTGSFIYTYDEFVDILDEDPKIMGQYSDYLTRQLKGEPEKAVEPERKNVETR